MQWTYPGPLSHFSDRQPLFTSFKAIQDLSPPQELTLRLMVRDMIVLR